MIFVMPVKTIPVLLVSFLFIMTGLSFSALFVEGFSAFNIWLSIILHLSTVFFLAHLVKKNREEIPLFGLSLGLWITVAIIGYGVGLLLLLELLQA